MGSDVRHVRGEAQKELVKKFEVFSSNGRSRWQVWSDWITMSAIAVSNATDQSHFDEREKQYLSIAGKYTRPEMCYLQMSLLGMPGYVVIGDTLASPSVSYDKRGLLPVDKGNVWYTPMLRIPVWQYRIFMAQMELVTQPIRKERVADAPKSEPQKSPEAPKNLEKPKNTEKPKAAKKPQRASEQEPVFSEGKGGQLSFF